MKLWMEHYVPVSNRAFDAFYSMILDFSPLRAIALNFIKVLKHAKTQIHHVILNSRQGPCR